jgi:O-succinylbenzoic acid--CoA ligase
MASVQGFQAYFQVESVNSCCVLPLYHVSGLMQCLRSLTSGGRLLIQPFQALAAGQIPDIEPEQFFISLVPTQLKRLLANPKLSQWLSHFSTVLLGGAPAWAELLDQARALGIRLAPTYGMTETASQIATLKPEAFLAGEVGCGQVLPHARVLIRNLTGEYLGCYQSGQIQIQAQSLALGYYPHLFSPDSRSTFLTDDLGFLDTEGALHVVGRDNDKLITGGENVFPAEVEAAIRSTDWVEDVCVIGLPDAQWGQVITAIYVPKHPQVSSDRLRADLTGKLSKFKHPKRWFAVDRIPRNAQGKVNRLKLAESLKPRIDGGSDDENERQEQL